MQLSFDLIESWLDDHPEVLGLKKNEESVFKHLALFQDYHGLPAFKDVSNTNFSDIFRVLIQVLLYYDDTKYICFDATGHG